MLILLWMLEDTVTKSILSMPVSECWRRLGKRRIIGLGEGKELKNLKVTEQFQNLSIDMMTFLFH